MEKERGEESGALEHVGLVVSSRGWVSLFVGFVGFMVLRCCKPFRAVALRTSLLLSMGLPPADREMKTRFAAPTAPHSCMPTALYDPLSVGGLDSRATSGGLRHAVLH